MKGLTKYGMSIIEYYLTIKRNEVPIHNKGKPCKHVKIRHKEPHCMITLPYQEYAHADRVEGEELRNDCFLV